MFQTAVLASGSKGNSVLVRSNSTAILIDAGISVRQILSSLHVLGMDGSQIKAVVISHEHSDHIRSAGAVSRTLHIPLYFTSNTLEVCAHKLGNIRGRFEFFEAGSTFEIGNLQIHPFSSSHDATDSCNFYVRCLDKEDRKLGLATDLGKFSRLTTRHLAEATTLILESNHDLKMLMEGPYDWHLKQRVKSSHGHLSNDQAVELISLLHHPSLQNLILAHLSEINNSPVIARDTMTEYLNSAKSDAKLYIANQYSNTPLIDI